MKIKNNQSNKNSWLIFGCACIFVIYVVLQMVIVNPLSPYLIKKFHLDAQQLSYLSATYLYACVLCVIPAGLLIDRFGVRNPLLAAAFLNVLGASLFALTSDYQVLLASRFLCGMGNSIAFIAPLRIASLWFPIDKQAAIKGLVFTAAMSGGVIAEAPLVWLINYLGIQLILYINFIIGFAITAAILLFIFDPAASKNTLNSSSKTMLSFQERIKTLFTSKQNWLCALHAAFLNLPFMIFGAVWGNLYLRQAHQLNETTAAHISSLIFYGVMFGAPFLGWLSNLLHRRLPLMYVSSALAAISLSLLIYYPLSIYGIGIVFFILGLSNSAQVIGYIVAAESNNSTMESTAASFVSLAINLLGSLFQMTFGWLIARAWNGTMVNNVAWYTAENYKIALTLMLFTFILSFFLPYFMKETYCRTLNSN